MPRITPDQAGGTNLCAFLDMLAVSEIGAAQLARSDDGYDVLVGSTPAAMRRFLGYADHPNIYNRALNSTAAGRYQLLYRWWVPYRAQLKLPDFSPVNQDRVALQQIRERGALPDILAGRFDTAVAKVANIWASLPGAGYGQHENRLADLRAAYVTAGGTLA
jgi:muramidase (phage lysozyme)